MQALVGVIDPELGRSVVELDMVRDVEIDGGRVDVTIALTVPGCPLRASFEEQVQSALAPVEGVESIGLGFDVNLALAEAGQGGPTRSGAGR